MDFALLETGNTMGVVVITPETSIGSSSEACLRGMVVFFIPVR